MIYVITHKAFDESVFNLRHYKVLHVGNNVDCKPGYLRDDVGDNISYKNSNYCELTGLYWIWKNATESDEDITGLVHYRRYLTTTKDRRAFNYFNIIPRPLSYRIISRLIDSGETDILLPCKIESPNMSMKEFYNHYHCIDDLEAAIDIIGVLYPEYLNTAISELEATEFYYANILICKRRTLNRYCEWLFPIMIELEKRIDIDKYEDDYQKRVFGFISERLLDIWIAHNNLKVREFPCVNNEKRGLTKIDVIMSSLKK